MIPSLILNLSNLQIKNLNMADGLNNSWLIILGVTGGLMTGASGMIFSIANKYNRAIK